MKSKPDTSVRRAGSSETNAVRAADALAEQLQASDLNGMIFFCSSSYDLTALGPAIEARFDCPVIGCTTAGEILSPAGYCEHSLVGVGFSGSAVGFVPHFIPSLTDFVHAPHSETLWPVGVGEAQFALLLVDGLSMLEERVASALQYPLRGLPMLGGSAGDDLKFKQTGVYHEGQFHRHAAALALFHTSLPFKTFHWHHMEPTDIKLVITEADASRRTVSEINGLPAAEEYACRIGVTPAELTPSAFAAHPVMLRIGGEYYVRSIQKANDDGSLTFYCAIDNGLVLTLGRNKRLTDHLRQALAELAEGLPGIQLILGCDCILRRLEVEHAGDRAVIRDILASYPFIGFSTYGEQYGGVHVNQTITGLAIGSDHE